MISQLLLSSLDHLRLVATSLAAQASPNPYAQSTLVRTATTGASTALWLLDSPETDERRYRAIEFHFNDARSFGQFLVNARLQRTLPQADLDEIATLEAVLRHRQEWLFDHAMILRPNSGLRFNTFGRSITSDTEIVRNAGVAIGNDQRVSATWDSSALLLKTWQALSGYAHCRPWASVFDQVRTTESDGATGLVQITSEGNGERLLDDAFLCVRVIQSAVSRYQSVSSPWGLSF